MTKQKILALFMVVGIAVSLSACADSATHKSTPAEPIKRTAVWVKKRPTVNASLSERDCLARAMYFESNRSSPEGMLAVGSVVMNRYESGRYGHSICAVVGAHRQFAPGVLSLPMTDRGAPIARSVADAVLSGERHAEVERAMHFHQAGLKFGYNNMHYVTVAGGNAFYEKRDRHFYSMMAGAAPPVQAAEFKQDTSEGRPGAIIVADTNNAPQQQASIEEPGVVEAVSAVAQPALAALLATAPLPPKRPKMLGMLTPNRQASAPTVTRVVTSNDP